jgi:hypothetical protein
MRPEGVSPGCLRLQELDSFMTYDLTGIEKARLDIFLLKPRISFQDGIRAVSSCKHCQDMFNSQTMPSNDWLAPENMGIHGYPL